MSMVELPPAYSDARLIVLMGSTGCGKSTIGIQLARQIDASFIEGDSHHSAQNKAKMKSGVPLTDQDRWPWLQRLANEMSRMEGSVVTSCSSLRKVYRSYIVAHTNEPVLFVYLHGSRELLASRLRSRHGHFMNKELLDSQLSTLEVPDESEFSITVDIDQDPKTIVQSIHNKLK